MPADSRTDAVYNSVSARSLSRVSAATASDLGIANQMPVASLQFDLLVAVVDPPGLVIDASSDQPLNAESQAESSGKSDAILN